MSIQEVESYNFGITQEELGSIEITRRLPRDSKGELVKFGAITAGLKLPEIPRHKLVEGVIHKRTSAPIVAIPVTLGGAVYVHKSIYFVINPKSPFSSLGKMAFDVLFGNADLVRNHYNLEIAGIAMDFIVSDNPAGNVLGANFLHLTNMYMSIDHANDVVELFLRQAFTENIRLAKPNF